MVDGQKFLHDVVRRNILRLAEKMTDEQYAFRPVPEVPSFGQLLGHIADAQYLFCPTVLGKPNPAPGIEKTKTWKAGLLQALNEAFAYCDAAFAGLTDDGLAGAAQFLGREQAKATVLSFNTAPRQRAPRQHRHLPPHERRCTALQREALNLAARAAPGPVACPPKLTPVGRAGGITRRRQRESLTSGTAARARTWATLAACGLPHEVRSTCCGMAPPPAFAFLSAGSAFLLSAWRRRS